MIGGRRVLAVTAGAAMSGYPFAFVEDLDRIGGDARLDLLASEAIRDGIIMPLDLDVVIQSSTSDTPFRKDIAFHRQWP